MLICVAGDITVVITRRSNRPCGRLSRHESQKEVMSRQDMVNLGRVNSTESRRGTALWRGSGYASPTQCRLFLRWRSR